MACQPRITATHRNPSLDGGGFLLSPSGAPRGDAGRPSQEERPLFLETDTISGSSKGERSAVNGRVGGSNPSPRAILAHRFGVFGGHAMSVAASCRTFKGDSARLEASVSHRQPKNNRATARGASSAEQLKARTAHQAFPRPRGHQAHDLGHCAADFVAAAGTIGKRAEHTSWPAAQPVRGGPATPDLLWAYPGDVGHESGVRDRGAQTTTTERVGRMLVEPAIAQGQSMHARPGGVDGATSGKVAESSPWAGDPGTPSKSPFGKINKGLDRDTTGRSSVGRAPALGAGGRAFKSRRPDHLVQIGQD